MFSLLELDLIVESVIDIGVIGGWVWSLLKIFDYSLR